MGRGTTARGKLPPHEIVKAIALQQVLEGMEKHLGKTCWEFLGQGKADFTAQQLRVVGGGRPKGRAVKKHWAKAKADPSWVPGKEISKGAGRPPQISLAQKKSIAEKAMALKKDLLAPTPARVRQSLPGKTTNRETKEPISDWSTRKVFSEMCYDDSPDDPWRYRNSPQQDALTDSMKPARVKTAQHILENVSKSAAWNFVALDPCFSLLPKHEEKAEYLKIAAMGNKKWMSPKSSRKGPNLRAPSTAKTQKGQCRIVPWTPVFTRGRLKLVVFTDPGAQLNNSSAMAAFVKNRLPGVLRAMKRQWKWTTLPRMVLHDKAAYFVNSKQDVLNPVFAAGLEAGKFTSWVDTAGGDCKWLAPHLGDLYLHETVISHVRRLLATRFQRKALKESPKQFAARMKKVEAYMNSEMGEGEALQKLGKELHQRCEDLKNGQGERLPK